VLLAAEPVGVVSAILHFHPARFVRHQGLRILKLCISESSPLKISDRCACQLGRFSPGADIAYHDVGGP
jgi:hypothetical protein